MGWFSKDRRDDGTPTLVEAWQMLGQRLGVDVSVEGDRAVSAVGLVRGVPEPLGQRALTPSVHERLAGLWDDVRIEVTPASVRLVSEENASLEGGWFVGIPFHVSYPSAPQPWPERAVAGPPWWIELRCDTADALDT